MSGKQDTTSTHRGSHDALCAARAGDDEEFPGDAVAFVRRAIRRSPRHSACARARAGRRRSATRRARPGRRRRPRRTLPRRRRRRASSRCDAARRRRSPRSAHRRASASSCPRRKNSGQTSLETSASTIGNTRRPAAPATFAPDGEADATAGPRHAAHLAHRPRRIGQVHEAERAERDVEARVGRSSASASMRAKRALDDAVRSALAGGVDHRAGQVDADDACRRAPTALAAASATSPVPQATSSTRSPGAGARAPAAPPARRQLRLPQAARSRRPRGPSRSAGCAAAAWPPCVSAA